MRDPIDVRVEVSPSPRVGLSSRLQVRLVSHWGDVAQAGVELEASGGLIVSVEGTFPLTLPKGKAMTWDLSVLPLDWGLSKLTVRVTGVSPHFGRVGGHAVIFLDLPQQGPGRIHDGNPPVVTPSGTTARLADRVPSPTRGSFGPPPLPATDATSFAQGSPEGGAPLPPQSHASFNVTGQWNYWLEDDTTTAPQRWATVEVWDEDPAGLDDLLWTGMTNETGSFTSLGLPRTDPDGPGNQDVYVRFVACNAAVCIQATNGTTYSWRTETVTVATEDTLDFGARASTANEFAQRPFQYINNGWDYAANRGDLGSILGRVRVLIPDSCTFYTLADDTIHLCADGIDDKSPDDVNHEYGHYVQDKMYGDSFWPSPGGVHSACGDFQHRGLSWTEGFADFFGPRANREIVDPTDHFYTRPWDGSLFRLDLEDTSICAASVRGDDNELRVATSLWDLTDDADDGTLDLGIDHLDSVVLESINGCDQSTYQDFYDSGVCNWVERGNPRLDFLLTAFQNTIDYNFAPVAEVTSPDVFRWARANILATANATDADTNVTRMEFGISPSATCANVDTLLRTDSTPPYAVTIDVSSLGEAANHWVCARASDEMETGGWAPSSASFGIDRTPPTTMATLLGTLGTSVWYVAPVTVELAATDTASGVAAVTYRLDGGEVQGYTAPFVVEGDGTHTLAFFAVDVAGNSEPIQPLLIPIDTGPPIIQILQPPTMGFVGQSDVVLQWSVTDAGSGVASCAVGLDGGPRILVEEERAFTFANVADGPHIVAVTCSDVLDRAAEVEIDFTVDTNPFSLTGPLGPTLVLGLVGLGLLVVALLIRRKR
ncbi:MAG: OmpL47-type beta-barrel domain-containing protein [Thermoplasmata archaeon]